MAAGKGGAGAGANGSNPPELVGGAGPRGAGGDIAHGEAGCGAAASATVPPPYD